MAFSVCMADQGKSIKKFREKYFLHIFAQLSKSFGRSRKLVVPVTLTVANGREIILFSRENGEMGESSMINSPDVNGWFMETLIFVCFGDSFERRRRDSAVFRHDRSVRPTNIIHTCSRSRPASTRNSSFSCAYSNNNSFGVYKTHKKFVNVYFRLPFQKK